MFAGALLSLFLVSNQASGQSGRPTPGQVHYLSITFGVGAPQSKSALRDFWLPGPGVALRYARHVTRHVAFGLSIDVGQMYFDRDAFIRKFPGVHIREQDVYATNISVSVKLSPIPRMRTSPFVILGIGVLRPTQAEYHLVIDGARVRYYNVGGSSRLAISPGAGVDIVLSSTIALIGELQATYTHNDPAVGVIVLGRAGIRFAL